MATETEVVGEGHGLPETVAEAPGMPQLDFSTFPNQIFWLIVTLFAIYFVLTRVALPRIAGVLAERQGTITNDLAAAEELKQKAAEAEAAYDKALADARAEAGRIGGEAKAEMQAEVDAGVWPDAVPDSGECGLVIKPDLDSGEYSAWFIDCELGRLRDVVVEAVEVEFGD